MFRCQTSVKEGFRRHFGDKMIEAKGTVSDTRTGHWSGEVHSLALDEQLVLVNPMPIIVEDFAGVYKLSRPQLTDGSLQVPYDLAQPRAVRPLRAVAVHYDK